MHAVVSNDSRALYCRGSPLTFSITPRDNVIMVRELLLSSTSSLCDECMLCEHVKHHIPEQLFVSITCLAPPSQSRMGKDKTDWEGCSETHWTRRELSKSNPWNTLQDYIFHFGLYQCVVMWFRSDWQSWQWAQLEIYMPLQSPVPGVTEASPHCSKLKTGGGLLCQRRVTSTLFPLLSSLSSLLSGVKWLKQLVSYMQRMHSRIYAPWLLLKSFLHVL